MAKDMVAGSDNALGRLSELLRQLRRGPQKGGLSLDHLQALNEHQNPFGKKEAESVAPRPRPQDQKFHFKSIPEQVRLLKNHFPELNTSYVPEIMYSLRDAELPKKAEGWVVVPKEAFDKYGLEFQNSMDGSVTVDISRKILKKYWEILINENVICKERDLESMLEHCNQDEPVLIRWLKSLQPRGDVFIFPVQFGACYKGKPLYQCKKEKDGREFLLNQAVLFTFLLTHPDYLLDNEEGAVQIGCGGTEIGDDRYSVWIQGSQRWHGGKINAFPTTGYGSPHIGWASGFVPMAPEVPVEPSVSETDSEIDILSGREKYR